MLGSSKQRKNAHAILRDGRHFILGIGNCLYHVGGGVDVLHFSETRQWMLGVYVSPGAIGLFLGGLLAQKELLSLPVGFVLILTASLLTALGYKPFKIILTFDADLIATGVSVVLVTVLNYILSKLLVFRKKKTEE